MTLVTKSFPLQIWAYRASLVAILVSLVPWVQLRFFSGSQYRGVFHMVAITLGFLSLLLFLRFAYLPLAREQSWIRFLAPLSLLGFFLFFLSLWFQDWLPHKISMAVAMGIWLGLFWLALFSLHLQFKGRENLSRFFWFWVYLALFFGHLGVGLTSLYVVLDEAQFASPVWLLTLGRGYLLQANFICLAVAFLVFAHPVQGPSFQLAIAFALAASFVVEEFVSAALGFGLRGAVILAILALPRGFFTHNLESKYLGISAAFAFAGYFIISLLPQYRLGGLHMVFLGGFLPWAMVGLRPATKTLERLTLSFLALAIFFRFLAEVVVPFYLTFYTDFLFIAVVFLSSAASCWLWNPREVQFDKA